MPFVSDDQPAPIPGDTAECGAIGGNGNAVAHQQDQSDSRPSLKLTLKRIRDDFWSIPSTNQPTASSNSSTWSIPSPKEPTICVNRPSWSVPLPNQTSTSVNSLLLSVPFPDQTTTSVNSPLRSVPAPNQPSCSISSPNQPTTSSSSPVLKKRPKFNIGRLAQQRAKERDLTHYDIEINKKANILQAYGNRVTKLKEEEQDLTREVTMAEHLFINFLCYVLYNCG